MSRDEKKNKFTQTNTSNTGIYAIVGVVVVIMAIGVFMFSKSTSGTDTQAVNVGATEYQTAEFAKIAASESGGDVVINLNEIKTKQTTTFEVPGISFTLNNGTTFNSLPLLAYVSPQGNVVVATSLCEPCSGITFHVEGDQLVCNACGTRWTLDSLQGVSGGCLKYPPETVKYTVQGDNLIIKKADLQNWKPRQV
ncbi:MAG: Fe-S-containing protein [Carboxydocellales bacterium]